MKSAIYLCSLLIFGVGGGTWKGFREFVAGPESVSVEAFSLTRLEISNQALRFAPKFQV